MTRRRFVQQKDGTLVEVGERLVGVYSHLLWNDRDYQNMGDPRFNSRSSHRQYMHDNNLSTADDWTETWDRAKRERDDHYTTGADHAQRREDLERAIWQSNKKK